MIIILIITAVGFWQLAKTKGLQPALWTIIAIVAYFAAQFLAGILIGLFAPELLYNEGALVGLGILASILGLVAVWVTMNYIARQNAENKIAEKDDLLDNQQEYLDEI